MNLEERIKQNEGTIVDVRTPEEFAGGNVLGSINIPMQEVTQRIEELKRMPSPLILCCASGNRSGQVQDYLKRNDIECYNGGSWITVNQFK